MKYAITFRLMLLISITLIVSNCCSKLGTANTQPVSTGNPTCDYAIKHFNKYAAGSIASDIRKVYSNRGNIPEDLKKLYPAARDAWNMAVRQVRTNYKNSYTGSSLSGLNPIIFKEWRKENLEDYQKFFLLLTEYTTGIYPEHTTDMEKVAAWIEKADAKRRLEVKLKALTGDCHSRDIELVKKFIDPALLPENIEDCYK